MSDALKSNRSFDSALEQPMQKHYNLVYRINSLGYSRCDDKDLQIRGQDLILKWSKTKQFITDEKCATSNWDRPLNTFAMELSFNMCDRQSGEQIGKRYDGWFVNSDNTTELYSLGYIQADSVENVQSGTLKSFECILISKAKLKKYLETKCGVENLADIEKQFVEMIESGNAQQNSRGRYFYNIAEGIKIVRSDNLAEQPINLVVSKSILSAISELHCTIDYKSEKNFTYMQIK